MPPVRFNITMPTSNFAKLEINGNSILIPAELAGDLSDAFQQVWLEYHSQDLEEKEIDE